MHWKARLLILGYALGHLAACKQNDDDSCYFPNGEIASTSKVDAQGSLSWLDGDTPVSCTLWSLLGSMEAVADTPGYRCSLGMTGAFSVAIEVRRPGPTDYPSFVMDVELFDIRTQTIGPLAGLSADASGSNDTFYGTTVKVATVRSATGGSAPTPDFVTADFQREIHFEVSAESSRGRASLNMSLFFTKDSFREARSWTCAGTEGSLSD